MIFFLELLKLLFLLLLLLFIFSRNPKFQSGTKNVDPEFQNVNPKYLFFSVTKYVFFFFGSALPNGYFVKNKILNYFFFKYI